MALDTAKNYVFTGGFDDGEIAVIDIEKPGKVYKEFSYLNNLLLNSFILYNIFLNS